MVTVEDKMASIRKRNGRYQAQIRLPGKPALSKTFSYKQDAQRWARDLLPLALKITLARTRRVIRSRGESA
ncbi:uncharacterized protein METZ01_LOCUS458929 [marine metagenome]|uniref:Uncharacterized protein n=1 Tax=marine metagenome TaxID=408172 RepID=A0A383AFV9_9ZZZZ